MNRNPIKLPPADSELVRLVELMCDGAISPAERDRLESLLENDRDAKLFYIAYLDLHAQMQWMMREDRAGEEGAGGVVSGQWLVASEEGAGEVAGGQWLVASEEGGGEVAGGQWSVASESDIQARNPEITKSPISNPLPTIILDDSMLPAPLSSLPFYISHPFVFSNLFALLVIGIGALGAWFYQVDIPHPVAESGRPSITKNRLSEAEKIEFVGRVTGMVDVKWADINTSTETGNGVPLGRKYALSAGLMEITYHTGAKVILQGPVTYEVDSRDGGFLSIGKLTAKLEKKPEIVASGQWLVASENNLPSPASGRGAGGEGGLQLETINQKSEIRNQKSSLSTIHYPLFTIKTPSAVVTDMGTEFGVEVKSDKSTAVCVARGVVEVTRDGHVGNAPTRERLVAGEAVYLSSSPAAAPQRMNSRLLHMTLAPDIKAAFDEVKTARHSNQCLTPIGLVASVYGRIWDIDGKLRTQNDRQQAFQVVTDGIFGRGGQKNEGPRSSFDTSAKGLGIRDWGLDEKNTDGTLRKEKSKSANTIPNFKSPIPNPTQFVGLRYEQPTRFDRIKVFLGCQMGDGGNWADVPRVFILKRPIDTNLTPPEQDSVNWRELPMRQLLGKFSPQPNVNPGMVLEVPLTGFSVKERTGYGWALGGVPGNGKGGYVSITELRAYTECDLQQDITKGGKTK